MLLLSLPWTTFLEPSLGLGILKSVLEKEGITSRVVHLNLFLLEHLKPKTYFILSKSFALNDFVFSACLDPGLSEEQMSLLKKNVRKTLKENLLSRQFSEEPLLEKLVDLRNRIVPQWLEEIADAIAACDARLVGFTCMFDQTIASLALAKMIRQKAPGILLALGGYAVRTPTAQMLLKSCPWVDCVCDGEGEHTIGPLARAAMGQGDLGAVPGIVYLSASGQPVRTASAPQIDINEVPVPNYDDFFSDTDYLFKAYSVKINPPLLPIENSRGCWWGAKSHCTFCGIKDSDLVYRSKDADKVLESMSELNQKYGSSTFRFADYILPNIYFSTLLPRLIKLDKPYTLSGEMKANLSEERFELLKGAGFTEFQPGIESFDSNVLRKMRKGVTAIQNVYTLLLGKRKQIRILYNLIYGFPDDEEQEYEAMVRLLPRLIHLDPPETCIPVQITRWAPLQTQPEVFNINPAKPHKNYDLIFSKKYMESTGFDMKDFCYYYERSFFNSKRLAECYKELDQLANQWKIADHTRKPALFLHTCEEQGTVFVKDRRGEQEITHQVDDDTIRLLRACQKPRALNPSFLEELSDIPVKKIRGMIDNLEELGLVFRENDKLISLLV